MLKNDKVNFVLALLIAIGLWTYVIVEVNPTKDNLIKDVPITFLHEDTLTEEGLALLSVSDTDVDVTITGKVSDLKGIKKDDIRIYADLEGFQAGEHTVRLQIGKMDNVELEYKQKISIVVDPLVTAEKPVRVSIIGDMSDDQEPYIVQTNPQKVQVTGAKTLVDSVTKVSAPLNVEKVENELKAFAVPLSPVDAEGNEVKKVTLNTSSASVSAVNLNKKTVRLEVPIVGQEIQNAERIVTVPKTITVKGMDVDLDAVLSISAEPIDISNIYEDVSIPVVPILPEGVEAAVNSQELQIHVSVKGIGSRSFEYSKEAIVLEGIEAYDSVTMEDTAVRLTVTGTETVTEHLTAADFTFAADVKDLGPGTHQVEIRCVHEKELHLVEFEPGYVTVVIVSDSVPEEETDGTDGADENTADEEENIPASGSGENTDADYQEEPVPEA